MALADSVPGVSGGTVAFLLGFYDKFIQSLNDIFLGKKQERIEAFKFLAKLLVGWLIGFCSAVLVLTSVFESHIYAISSLFLGFIIFAIPYVIAEEKETIKGHWWHLIFAVIGIAVVVVISLLNPATGSGLKIDVGSLNPGLIIYVFVAAAIAITAMILPGISGALGTSALMIRNIEEEILKIRRQDYVDFAYSKGLKKNIVRNRYILKNVMVSTITLFSMRIVYMFAGSVVIETVFALPGLGSMLMQGILARDYALVQGLVYIFAVIVLVLNLLTDISYSFINPRIRLE